MSYIPTFATGSHRPGSPARQHREVCWITPTLAVSGDLPNHRGERLAQLQRWQREGLTHVLDVREERDDSVFIREHSTIEPHWLGVDDHWGAITSEWFEAVTAVADRVYESDDEARLLVHCHMGVNRGPSAAFAILLARGWEATSALEAIREARPFAGILYAPEAAEWFATSAGASEADIAAARNGVVAWLEDHPIDLPWVIRSIGWRTA